MDKQQTSESGAKLQGTEEGEQVRWDLQGDQVLAREEQERTDSLSVLSCLEVLHDAYGTCTVWAVITWHYDCMCYCTLLRKYKAFSFVCYIIE